MALIVLVLAKLILSARFCMWACRHWVGSTPALYSYVEGQPANRPQHFTRNSVPDIYEVYIKSCTASLSDISRTQHIWLVVDLLYENPHWACPVFSSTPEVYLKCYCSVTAVLLPNKNKIRVCIYLLRSETQSVTDRRTEAVNFIYMYIQSKSVIRSWKGLNNLCRYERALL